MPKEYGANSVGKGSFFPRVWNCLLLDGKVIRQITCNADSVSFLVEPFKMDARQNAGCQVAASQN
jgi:hypothetical protein